MNEPKKSGLVFLLAVAVGVTAANLYYAQPLVALVSQSLGLAPELAGLVVTLTQIGYGLGVLFLVPLGDILENRRLILCHIALTVAGLLGLAFATNLLPYFAAAFATGLGASTVQIIVPYAAALTPPESRGRVVGNLMSGLMLGIMLSRPTASFLTDLISWHAVFVLSAGMMAVLGLVLYRLLPERKPENLNLSYGPLVASMGRLFVNSELLRRRALYQAAMFGAFCLFWTAVPLLLASPVFHMSQTEIALFALAGVSGAVSAPFAGKFADRGKNQIATTLALLAGSVSFLLTHVFAMGSMISLAALVVAAVVLDAGVSANLVLGQRAIFTLDARSRARLNGLYIATIFVGGAIGSAAGAWAYARGGWTLTSLVGLAMPACAFAYFMTGRTVE
jgi:predicted MFS family arabinose efflux permease